MLALVLASIGQAAPASSNIAIIRDSAAFKSLPISCAGQAVATGGLDEKSANASPPARFESVIVRCGEAFVAGLFVLDRDAVTLLSTCQMEPSRWAITPIAVSARAAVVISGECGGADDGGDSVAALERLVAIGRKQSGAWVRGRVPNSMHNCGELSGEDFSEFRIQTSSSGSVLVAEYHWDGGHMDSDLNVKSEIAFRLSESEVQNPATRMLSASFIPVDVIDAYSTIESNQKVSSSRRSNN